MKLFYGYLIVVSIAAFIMMAIDKRRAYRHRWRIPENILLLLALIGGSGGAVLGMWLFRHKTRHKLFSIGLPVILVIQCVLVLLITRWVK